MKTTYKAKSLLTHLACSECGKAYDAYELQTFSACCQKPLSAQYDLAKAPARSVLKNRPHTMWRYREFLPVFDDQYIVSLHEGYTPVLQAAHISAPYGIKSVFIKDEAGNPTGSFKARGQSTAISKARELGVTEFIVPTAGNAGGAMSAYCARAGSRATVVMPAITPQVFKDECELYGARVVQIDGLISDCGKEVRRIRKKTGAFEVSTMKEPYRLEGKKTMGYEIAEQFDWNLPDYIFYPAGGGTGLIGIWKAFREMQAMGWISGPLPKMIAVQSANCQPVVRAYDAFRGRENGYRDAKPSIAYGLAVPEAFGHDMMMRVITESGGAAMAVREEDIISALQELAMEGMMMCPEGAATWDAMLQMKNAGTLTGNERILLLNTGSAYKYMDRISEMVHTHSSNGYKFENCNALFSEQAAGC